MPANPSTTLDSCSLSTGRIWFYAALSAICMVAAFPPFGWWWMAFLTPTGWIILAATPRLPRWWWIAVSLCAWAMWMWFELWMIDVTSLGYPIACVYLAIYAPLGIWLMRRASQGVIGRHLPYAVLAPVVICSVEWLKDVVIFDGYPWYSIGQPLIEIRTVSQIADLGGAVLASVVVAMVGGAVVDLRCWWCCGQTSALRQRAIYGGGIALAIVACSVAYGAWRLQETHTFLTDGPRILVVQTNLTTDNKIGWPRERQERDVMDFGRMTIALADEEREKGNRIDLVVWPETMLPGFGLEPQTIQTLVDGGWWPGDHFSSFIAMIAKRVGAPLLVGSPAFLGLRPENQHWAWDRQFNSAYLVDGDAPFQRYDKVFLTPFGETMPYISQWTWLEEQLLALGARGMTFDLDASPEFRRISLAWSPLNQERKIIECATPICFEDTVPSIVRRLVHDENGSKKAQLIVNLSNDGWFGFSDWGRAQHALIARWRCIENRAPMIRVANTGISQAFTSEGAAIEGDMVSARTFGGFATTVQLDRRETVFGRWGDVLSPMMALSAFILILKLPVNRMSRSIAMITLNTVIVAITVQFLGCSSESNPRPAFSGTSWSSRSPQPDPSPVVSNELPSDTSPIQSPPVGISAEETHFDAIAPSNPLPIATDVPTHGSAIPSATVGADSTFDLHPSVGTPSVATLLPDHSKVPVFDANAPSEKIAINLLIEASLSSEPIYRAHALEGLQSRVAELQPIACRLLADQNPGVRFAAAVMVGKKRLVECGHLVEPLVLDPSPSVQAAALYALVRLGRIVDLNLLAALAMSSDAEIRSNTFFVLGELRNPSAIPLVESAVGRRLVGVDQTRARIVDLQAAESMAKMGDYRQFDPIRAALFVPSEQAEILALACQMVGETNDRGARGHLISLWNGKGPLERPIEIRLIAGAALARIGEPNLEPILQLCQVAAKDSAPTIRGQAAATMGWVGGQRALDALALLMRDPLAMVRLTAAAAYLRASPDQASSAVSTVSDANVR